MNKDILVRKIRTDELAALLALYEVANAGTRQPQPESVKGLWQRIMTDPYVFYLVADLDGRIVSSCSLALLPNLSRGARPFGVVENVVTLPEYHSQGIESRVLKDAARIAWSHGCYKVMLLQETADETLTTSFRDAGFEAGAIAGFVATPATAIAD